MNHYQYRAVPFIGRIKGSGSADQVSAQLQNIIDVHARDGWEFHSLGNVNIEVRPGCLGAIVGAKVSYIRYDQLVFQRSVQQ